MDIGIIGGGSLGLLLTSYLHKEHQVSLYVRRKEQAKLIQKRGITLDTGDEVCKVFPSKVKDVRELVRHDVLFVAVKQPDLPELLAFIKEKSLQSSYVFLQNGMGHIEDIKGLPQSIYIGIVDHGAKKEDDTKVKHLGRGKITLSSLKGATDPLIKLADALHTDSFPFTYTKDWRSLLEGKLIVNAVINPLTAIFDVPNGDIIHKESLRKIARQLTKETARVLKMEEEEAWDKVERVASITAKNTSSMRADILQGRRTEVEAITGYILKLGEPQNLPFTTFVYYAILTLEERGK